MNQGCPQVPKRAYVIAKRGIGDGEAKYAIDQIPIWASLEDTSRVWTRARGELYVITVPMFYDPKEENPLTADGSVTYRQIGQDHVAVPTHFYKIAVTFPRGAAGEPDAIAFVMENRAYPKPFHLDHQIVPIKWIEERTGLIFMPKLAAPAEHIKNDKVGMWPPE